MANDPTDLTKFPVPSSSAYVLERNTQDIDTVVNGGNQLVTTRNGRQIPSLEKVAFDLGAVTFKGDYAGATAYTVYDAVFDVAEVLSSPGAWYIAPAAFTSTNISADVAAGDLVLFRDKSVLQFGSISELQGKTFTDGQQISVAGYHSGSTDGGGIFVWSTGRHNGGTFIDPNRAFPTDWSDQTQLTAWFADSGVDVAGWKRSNLKYLPASSFGLLVNQNYDQGIILQKINSEIGYIDVGEGQILTSMPIIQASGNIIKGAGIDKTTIKAIPVSGSSYFSAGSIVSTNPSKFEFVSGCKALDITIDGDDLFDPSGTIGLKGITYTRVHNFLKENVRVKNISSYGIWDRDDAEEDGGTVRCSGINRNCLAVDCSIGFEQVNSDGIILENCHAYDTGRELPFTVYSMFHPYGGSKMNLTYMNCTGVGNRPAIFDPFLTCKKVRVISCYFENTQSGSFAMFMDNNGDYDEIQIISSEIIGAGGGAVVTRGASGSNDATIKFIGSKILGSDGVGVEINSNVGAVNVTFTDSDVKGVRTDPNIASWAIYDNGGFATVRFVGGSCIAEGGLTQSSPTNLGTSIFSNSKVSPSTASLPTPKQRIVGSGVFSFDGAYGFIDAVFPSAIAGDYLNAENVTVEAVTTTHPRNGDNAVAQSAARSISFAMRDNQTVRIYADNSSGIAVHYVVTEWEM